MNGKETIYVWNGDQIVLELNHKGSVKKRYIRGNDLICMDEGAGTEKRYYVTDLHGNVVQLVDETGKVTKSYEYDAFGNEINPDKKDDNPFRYCGEYYDKETESVYLRARYYSPEQGRFTTRDTYEGEEENPTSLNLYTYCGNDGVNAWDPSGHKPSNFKKYFTKKYKKIPNSKYSPIRVKLKGNKVNVSANIHIVWAGKKKKILKSGIESRWSGKVVIGKYKVKVKTTVNTKIDYDSENYGRISYKKENGTCYADFTNDDWDSSKMFDAVIYSKYYTTGKKRTNTQLKNATAHEFGHLLGIEDAYLYDNISPESDIMRWETKPYIKMSKYDVLLFLKAFAYNKGQSWRGIKSKDLKFLGNK